MANLRTNRFLHNYVARYQLTHILRIPLATSKSRPQLEASLRRAMTDPTSENIHGLAFARPDMLYLNLGSLSLTTPELCDNAIDLLRGLNLQNILQGLMRQLPSLNNMLSMPEPFKTSLIGLKDPSPHPLVDRLYALVIDPHDIKAHFCDAIRENFLATRLRKLNDQQSSKDYKSAMHTKIVNNARLFSTTKIIQPSIMTHYRQRGEVIAYARLKCDVQEFYFKYKDFTWAHDFQLERLAISEIRQQYFVRDGRVVGRGYRDVASVPLPGAPDVDLEANMEGITYEPVKDIYDIDPHARYDVTSRS